MVTREENMKKRKWMQRIFAFVLVMAVCLAQMDFGQLQVKADDSDSYSVTISPSATSVTVGDTVNLTATVTYNGEEITDLSGNSLYLCWWVDTYTDEHSGGNSDASLSDGSNTSLTNSITVETAGTYYIAAALENTDWSNVTDTVYVEITVSESSLSNEGYSIEVSPSATTVTVGDTVNLTATVTYNGEEITDLSGNSLYLCWWVDTYTDEHSGGNSDASLSDGSNTSLTNSVTVKTAGTYYIAAALENTDWSNVADTLYTTITVTESTSTDGSGSSDDEDTYTITVSPSTADVTAGDTVSLAATVTKNGEEVTDLSSAGLYLWWWTDSWNSHSDGNSDASYSNYDGNSGNSFTADVTVPTAGTYYIAAELKDETSDVADTVYCTITVSESASSGSSSSSTDTSTAVEADINVDKVDNLSDDFIMGMDISSIMSEFASGVTYQDFDGNTIDNITDFCKFLAECGVTCVRVRIWNDPYDDEGNGYGGGNNDVATAVEIAKGCYAAGLSMLLDFHCSDFWTDPDKQSAPKTWSSYSVSDKESALGAFLTNSLTSIAATGVDIAMVQVGNETTTGFIGETSTENMCTLFSAGASAIRSFDENIKIVIHVTNPEKSYMTTWAANLETYGVDYDVLATSYYPSWHGTFANLASQLKAVQETYGKEVMIAETSYAYTLDDSDGHENTIRSGNNDEMMCETQYAFSVQGQANYLRDLIEVVSDAGGIGVFYWESAWITVGDTTGLSDDDYTEQVTANKALWEKYGSGWASSYAYDYDPDDAGVWYGGSAVDNQALFAADGSALASINVWKYVRTGAVSSSISVDAIDFPEETIYEGESYTLPSTVTVTYNTGDVEESVTWDADDVNAIDVSTCGTYVVNGVVALSEEVDSGTYAGLTTADVTYTLTVKPTNLVGEDDWSFENGSSNFSISGGGAALTGNDPYDGNYALHWWIESEDTAVATYLGEDQNGITLSAGTYTFEVLAQGEVGDTVALSIADHSTGDIIASGDAVELTGWANWQTPTVTFTLTETTTVDLVMTVGIQAGGWGTIDCMYLYELNVEIASEVAAGAPSAVPNITEDSKETLIAAAIAAGILADAQSDVDDINITLHVNNVNETEVAEEIKAIETVVTTGGYTVGQYFDLTLICSVGNTSGKLTDLSSAISISVTIPESLRADGRTYAIARYHNGEATIINGVYDSSTGSFTFETDGFSTYAIVYYDGTLTPATTTTTTTTTTKTKTTTGTTSTTTSTASASTAEAASTSTTVTAVETGDVPVIPFMALMAAAVGMMGTALFMRRKRTI